MIWRIIIAAVLLAPLLLVADGASLVHCWWTAPTTGTPVKYYEVYHRTHLTDWELVGTTPIPEYEVPCAFADTNFVYVVGVDSLGRKGVRSKYSDPYVYGTSGVPMDPFTPEPQVVKSTGCFRGRK